MSVEGVLPSGQSAARTGMRPLTSVEDQLCRATPHVAGVTSLELWCPLSLPIEYVACSGVFNIVQSSPLSVLALGPPRRCRPRSAAACVLHGATKHELHCDLPVAT